MPTARTLERRAQRTFGRASARAAREDDHPSSIEPFVGPPSRSCDGCGAEPVWLVRLVFGPLAGRRLCADCLPPLVQTIANVPPDDGGLGAVGVGRGSPSAGAEIPSVGTKFHEEERDDRHD